MANDVVEAIKPNNIAQERVYGIWPAVPLFVYIPQEVLYPNERRIKHIAAINRYRVYALQFPTPISEGCHNEALQKFLEQSGLNSKKTVAELRALARINQR